MTYEEALNYINTYTRSPLKRGLARSRELMNLLGNPQKELKFVHVAGTNGKGSTCAMTEKILRLAGYTTGFFPSPFLEDFCERIQVGGEMISHDDLARIAETVITQAEKMPERPTHFEIITAIGMLYFRERRCDIAVLEVGMGGEFDSTNVIDAPEVAVIANIGLDHTEFLGDNIEEIARTKSGIIKPGSSVAIYENVPSVMKVIENICKENGNKIYRAADEKLNCKVNLVGAHQMRNARTVLAIIHALRDRGWKISEEAVEEGLATVTWPARFEILRDDENGIFILDGGHNPQCAQALVEAAEGYLGDQKVTYLIGMLADKNYREVIDIICRKADSFVTITPDNHRALDAHELAKLIEEKGYSAKAFDDKAEAIRYAMAMKKPVIAFGSLYGAGEIRTLFRAMENCIYLQHRLAISEI